MAIRAEEFVGIAPRQRRPFTLGEWVDRGTVFSWLMMAPPILFILAFVGYPFCYGIFLSLEDRPVAHAGTFIGLGNFIKEAHDPVFWQVVRNTFVYTGVATLLKMVGGLGLALAMNQDFKFKNIIRALLLLPFIVPTVLSTVAFMWMLDPAFSVINRVLIEFGWPKPGPSWLGSPILAMCSIIAINTACRSTGSPCWPGCRPCRSSSTRRQPSTARAAGNASAMSPCRSCSRSS
jgi:multiple sugar transport system permease protein